MHSKQIPVMESPSRMGGTDVSDVPDCYLAERCVSGDDDGAVGSLSGFALENDAGKAGVFVQIHTVSAGNQDGTFTEAKVHIYCARLGDLFHAGQVDGGLTEGRIYGAVA